MRILKWMAATTMAAALVVPAAFAGDNCSAKATQASAAGAGCCASKHASAGCTAQHTAACTAMMQNCKVEATRLASGDLVVHYIGTTPEAVTYLHTQAASSPDKFCCPQTQKMASNEACKVDMTKVSNGVLVFVSSPKKEVVDAYEKEFAAMTAAAPSTATK